MSIPARQLPLLMSLLAAGCPLSASATYSIAACDADGSCGIAVATRNLALGAPVPDAQAGMGALASPFGTRPAHGARRLAHQHAPAQVLDTVLIEDDGQDGDARGRQRGAVMGSDASTVCGGRPGWPADWSGSLQGEGLSVQGNGLAGPQVLAEMRDTFQRTRGNLAQRLMAALEAGQAAGGQRIGAMSAALLVRTPQGGWMDVDLRVDAAEQPVQDLRALLDRRQAHELLLRAERLQRAGDAAGAAQAADRALALAHDWDRLWRRAARLAMEQGDRPLALARLGELHRLNPVWTAMELREDLYASLADDADVRAWR